MLRNSVSGPEIGLRGRFLAGSTIAKHRVVSLDAAQPETQLGMPVWGQARPGSFVLLLGAFPLRAFTGFGVALDTRRPFCETSGSVAGRLWCWSNLPDSFTGVLGPSLAGKRPKTKT